MNNKVIGIFMFAAGAAIGSAVTWKLVKTKYEQIAQEEIDSVKEVYAKKTLKYEHTSEPIAKVEKVEESEDGLKVEATLLKPDIREFAAKWAGEGYTNYSKINQEQEEKEMEENKPYVIPPDELGESDGYDFVSLTYYADGVLVDDWGEVIDEDVVGAESLTHFGEYEEDSVFVRDDKNRVEYEILRDTSKYVDIAKLGDE